MRREGIHTRKTGQILWQYCVLIIRVVVGDQWRGFSLVNRSVGENQLHFEKITHTVEQRSDCRHAGQPQQNCPTLFTGSTIYAKIRAGSKKCPKQFFKYTQKTHKDTHPEGWYSGPQDANQHCESQAHPLWNLQMVYPGICFRLAVFHHYWF